VSEPIDSPVAATEGTKTTKLEKGIGLCLSGGGYRAMLFHLGSLWRLNELGLLPKMDRISSVSGGSITSAVLAMNWDGLDFREAVAENFEEKVVSPVRSLAGRTLDKGSVLGGLLLPGTVSERIEGKFEKHLFGKKTLQHLPDKPRFVFNATNVQTGVLWRFSKPYMADYKVGKVNQPDTPLALVVAASSAFPPVLSPVQMKLDPERFEPGSGDGLQREPFTSEVVLTDGGVYDNLGLETVWKRYRTVLVSDAGGQIQPEEDPEFDWARHSYRVLGIIDNQVRALRKRQLLENYKRSRETESLDDPSWRKGAYWGIRTDIADYELQDALEAPFAATLKLAAVPTRFKRLPPEVQEQLINWGYAVCDAAMRKYGAADNVPEAAFPYPDSPL